tara:strand:+ start:318 stop:527 length:210 start_codon:yes stop_codon:yes gene_type:complete
MKKYNQENAFTSKNFSASNHIIFERKKTTNVNILLNRVKLDKKKDFKQKVINIILLLSVVCFITAFAIF